MSSCWIVAIRRVGYIQKLGRSSREYFELDIRVPGASFVSPSTY